MAKTHPIQTLALIATLLFTLPFFFIGGPDWQAAPLYRQVWNGGHIAFFCLSIVLIRQFIALNSPRHWLVASLMTLAIGLIIETIQQRVGRQFSYTDLAFNLAGLWLGLSWTQSPTKFIWLLRLGAGFLLAPFFWSLTLASQLQLNSSYQFPTITSFESRSELLRVSGPAHLSNQIASDGKQSLKIDFDSAQYSTVSIDKPLGDWLGYQFLALDIYNPDTQPLRLVLRISDTEHDRGTQALTDRFNIAITVTNGWNNTVLKLEDIQRAPLTRELDLSQLTNIAIFSQGLEKPRTVYLDNIRLQQ
ncbi:hypothetical protein QWY82_16870 [Simiduia curdlanivorans]|uniref:VanZ-like domain-containing protein n=1 Tax=Simiduia curdlanivorans TaxID=1492769 RepID=A0ABV8V0U3_9GAMM|nr:hypothetical protein [Simiduia curdlanivorans]MDN3640471.1 hypothetical protein [Simiduia curdlanivorans]